MLDVVCGTCNMHTYIVLLKNRDMFNVFCSDQQSTATLQYGKLKRNLRRIKNGIFPASLTNGTEITNVFADEKMLNMFGKTSHDDPAIFYKGTLVHENHTCSFFFF